MLDLPVLRGDAIGDEPLTWPIVSHETLGSGVISDFVRDVVRSPDGADMKRDYLLHPGAVGIIALDDAENVVVVRQFRHPVGFRLIEPPAGLLDGDGESYLEAAQRELAEEAELEASDWRILVDFMTSPGCLQETLRVYLARGLAPAARPDGFVVEHEEAGHGRRPRPPGRPRGRHLRGPHPEPHDGRRRARSLRGPAHRPRRGSPHPGRPLAGPSRTSGPAG